MFGLTSIGTAIKAAAVIGVAALIAAAAFYVVHLRSENASLTQANQVLQGDVQIAKDAAEKSAQAAKDIQAAAEQNAAAVATEHQAVMASTAQADSIEQEFHLAPIADLSCTPDSGLPPAFSHALDELYGARAAAGAGAGGGSGKAQGAPGVPPGLPAVAAPAAAH